MRTGWSVLAVAAMLAVAGCGGDDEDGGDGDGGAQAPAATETAEAPRGPSLAEIKACLERGGAETEDGVAVLVFGLDQAKGGGFQATFPNQEEVDVVVAADEAEREKLIAAYEDAGGNRSGLTVQGNAIAETGAGLPDETAQVVGDCLEG